MSTSEDGSDQFVMRDHRKEIPVITGKNYADETVKVPSFFMDWDQRKVLVYGEYVLYEGEQQKWECPRRYFQKILPFEYTLSQSSKPDNGYNPLEDIR